VKAAYLFCRYYPLAIAPFHFWGFLGDHEQRVCEAYYHTLYASIIPSILSAQFILMLRTYAFSGRKKNVLAVLSITFFILVGVIIWVMSKELALSLLSSIERTGCFALSDQPSTISLAIAVPVAYHLVAISILATFFDCLNMFIVVWHWVRRGTLGPLGQSFLKQGILVYVVMTAINAMTIVSYLSSSMMYQGLGASIWFGFILPSALSCRLVLILRRTASPTERELRVEHSHMVNEALEMIAVESHPEEPSEETSKGFIPSFSADAQAQP
jgi:hypothetical protein